MGEEKEEELGGGGEGEGRRGVAGRGWGVGGGR